MAEQASGRVLHPGPQALLSRLLAVRKAPQGPAQPRPGALHRGAHPRHPPHDRSGGVEEQTQRGDRVVEGQILLWGVGGAGLENKGGTIRPHRLCHNHASVTKGSLLMTFGGFK